MYNLADFKPFDNVIDNGQMKVLVWTEKQGYFFTEYGFIIDLENTKIIAKEK